MSTNELFDPLTAEERALAERIEDEYDLCVAEQAHRDLEMSGMETYDYKEFIRSLDYDVYAQDDKEI